MSQTIRIPDGFVEELKARIRPSDVIGRKVKLVKKGKEWVGLSPFTAEKTPSFYVNDQKRIFKCFSSGMGGDVISFVMETERLSFMEAVEKLAEEAGMSLPKASPEAAEEYDHRKRLQAACEAAAAYFEDRLQSSEGVAARAYLEGRGLLPAAWRRHRLGYSPDDWRKTIEHLKTQGFTMPEILEAGLAKESDKGGEPYDAFRGRLMFPIPDSRGGIIAFGGRGLTPDAKPKYLNSGDTPLFHKSRVLYRYKAAREALGHGEGGGLIVCEGYMDAIALAEAGFGQAVAPLGTALTEEQISLLWRAGPEPVLCFDGDKAGLGAAFRAIDRALPHVEPGRSLYFVLLPDGMDPDDLIRASGPAAMKAALEGAIPLSELLWRREVEQADLKTPEQHAALESRLMSAISVIKHKLVREAYERNFRQRLKSYLWKLARSLRTGTFKEFRQQSSSVGAVEALKSGGPVKIAGFRLMIYLVDNPWILDELDDSFILSEPKSPVTGFCKEAIYDRYVSIIQGKPAKIDRDWLQEIVSKSEFSEAAKMIDSFSQTKVAKNSAQHHDIMAGLDLISLSYLTSVDQLPPPEFESLRLRHLRERVAERERRRKNAQMRSENTMTFGSSALDDFWKAFDEKYS